jgi:SAM-dependent methyltransferase
MAANTAVSALDVLSRCGRYAGWLYDLAAPYLGRRIVEVGAGLGTQSQVMLDSPGSELKEFLLTDSDPARVKALSQRFGPRSNVRAAAWTLPEAFPAARIPGEFRPDTFVGWNVLEHIEDDVRALREMREALEPGGRVVMLSPAGPGLMSALDSAVGHFRRYARRELARKALAAGLEPVLERSVNLAGAIGWYVAAKLFARTELPEGPSRLFDLLVPVLRLWEDRLPIPWGLSVLFVAEKPSA